MENSVEYFLSIKYKYLEGSVLKLKVIYDKYVDYIKEIGDKPLGYKNFRVELTEELKTSKMLIKKKKNTYFVLNIMERPENALEEMQALTRAYFDLW